jgi:hypothetical protein
MAENIKPLHKIRPLHGRSINLDKSTRADAMRIADQHGTANLDEWSTESGVSPV